MKEYYKIIAKLKCPFCIKAKELLIKNDEQFMFCLLDESPDLLSIQKDEYNWQTVPIILHYKKTGERSWDSEFIGGYSDLVKKFEKNDD